MNTFFKILAALAAVVALAVGAIFYFTADMVSSAEGFFTAIKRNNLDEAYGYLSEDFRTNTSKAELGHFLGANGIDDIRQADWQSRSVNGGRGKLTGSVTTENNGVVPLSLSFVKSRDGWKIYSIEKPASGIRTESGAQEMPSERQQVRLVSESMHVFAESLNDGNMIRFHSHVSGLWQQQFSPENFEESFAPFFGKGLDLTVLKDLSPQFTTRPMINDEGVLIIKGQYPTKPKKVFFEQKYIYEGLGWKLVGFSADIK